MSETPTTSLDREQARLSLLRYTAAAAPRPVSLDLLDQYLHAEGLRLTHGEVEAEAQYLVDKGLCQWAPHELAPERRRLRITAAGRDHLATASA